MNGVSRLKDPLWAQHNDALTKPSHSEILNPRDTEKTQYSSEKQSSYKIPRPLTKDCSRTLF